MKGLFFILALVDHGIYSELDERIDAKHSTVKQPRSQRRLAGSISVRLDPQHGVLTLYQSGAATSVFPVSISGNVPRAESVAAVPFKAPGGGPGVLLRPDDLAALQPFLRPTTPVVWSASTRAEDHDNDGIVDRLDILRGAKKLIFNRATYVERYVPIAYPGGDVPRTEGVCTDTVIRALRNAGIDLQKEVHEDILRAPKAYPMVDTVNASINHRRVKTLLPWFQRHFDALQKGSTFLPGDVVFFDTFVSRPGPDHIGIVSDRPGPSGKLLVINNWTNGTVDAEMDLLDAITVTHHFRVR